MNHRIIYLAFRPQQLIFVQLFIVCTVLFFVTEVGAPAALMNITDVITCCAAMFAILARIRTAHATKLNYVDVAILIFLAYALMTSLINGINLLQVIWALRVTFRFYVFYYCCIILLGQDDVRALLRMFEILFAVNAVLVVFEYLLQGKQGDYLGGMFGIEQGTNVYMNIYLTLMLAYEISRYLRQQQTLPMLAYYFVVALGIAALAEMKFLYIEIVIIVAGSVLLRYPSKKTFVLLGCSLTLLFAGLQMLRLAFPESYELLFTGEGTNDYLSAAWTGGREMGRTTAITFIDNSFFSSQTIHETYTVGFGNLVLNRLFGFGFGSAEPSALTHNLFAEQYSGTQYAAFEFADRYLEMGWIGLFLYASIYILMFVATFSNEKTLNEEQDVWRETARVLIPIALVNIWYGNLRTEASYMLFFFLALPRIRNTSSIEISRKRSRS